MASVEKRLSDKTFYPKGSKCPCCVSDKAHKPKTRRKIHRAACRQAKKYALKEANEEIFFD